MKPENLTLIQTPTTNKLVLRKIDRIAAYLVHASGQTDLDAILNYYTQPNKVFPMFLVQTNGTVRQFCEYDHVANHAAMPDAERNAYARGLGYWTRCDWDDTKGAVPRRALAGMVMAKPRPCFNWWKGRWPALQSPLELATKSSPNQNSIGIEFQSPLPTQRTPRVFLDVQYEAGAIVLATIKHRIGLEVTANTVLAHSDVNPLRRTTDKAGAYDPGEKFDWKHLFDLYQQIA